MIILLLTSKMLWSEGNRIITKLYVSSLKTVQLASFSTKKNPGAGRRMKIAEDSEELDLDDLDYEANFESVGSSHKQYMREMEAMKEKLQYDIVKRKYFSTKFPNFLTWHDKEQIRLLHKKDPVEWNIMKLSEGFPALPDTIKKIIKSNWRMESVEKMKRHDETVRENWKKLRNNEYTDFPSDLITHLKKFSNRQFNYHNYDMMESPRLEYKPQLTTTEFSDIITSYEELKRKNMDRKAIASKNDIKQSNNLKESNSDSKVNENRFSNSKNASISHSEEDTFITEPIKNKQSMTLSSFKNKLKNELESGKDISNEEVSIIELDSKNYIVEKPQQTDTAVDQMNYTKYNTGKLMQVDEKKPLDYSHLIYPEKIKIPKNILKKGCTYKLNDCFYSSDGTFLYRVPGMQ